MVTLGFTIASGVQSLQKKVTSNSKAENKETEKIKDPIDIALEKAEKDVNKSDKKDDKKDKPKEQPKAEQPNPSVSEINQETEPVVVEEVVEDVIEDPIEEVEPVEEVYVEEYVEPQTQSGFAGTYTITAYTATGNPTASGEMPYSGGVASCDFPLGTVLTIEGVGTFIVNDVCPTSGVIDVYMNSYDECVNFGVMSANVYI